MIPIQRFSVMMVELAAELGLNQAGLVRVASTLGIETRKRRCHPDHRHLVTCVQRKDADILRAHHALKHGSLEEIGHWLTADEAARALGLSVKAFHLRRHGGKLKDKIQHRRLYGPGIMGNQARYNPADVAREAAKIGIHPRTAPRGTISAVELAQIVGRSRSVGTKWKKAGCPHIATVDNDLHFRPAEVLNWLDNRLVNRSLRIPNHLRVKLTEARDLLAARLAGQERAA